MQKIDMSIAIVCMINNTALKNSRSQQTVLTDLSQNSSDHLCPSHIYNAKIKHDGPFAWRKSTQGLILSAYFYGYIITQIKIPGGWLSYIFSVKKVIAFSMGIGSLITILIPFFARLSYKALIVCLFFTGLAHGAFWPSASAFWAYWAPNSERSRLVGIASSGSKLGNIIALSLGGILCVYGFDGGWPSIFYIFGCAGIVWSVLMLTLASDTPSEHRFIGKREKEFIFEETKKSINIKNKIPWTEILTSKACLSIFIAHFAHNWGNYLFLTQIPSFLKDVLHFDIKSNGFVSSIPYAASWVATTIACFLSDYATKNSKISRTMVRRIFSAIGHFIPAFLIIGLSFIDCSNVVLGVIILTLGVSFDAVNTGAGYLVNINDIAGPYSGILFGVSNTIATLPGILSPYIAGLMTKNHSQEEWQMVFIICSVIYIVGGIISLFLLDANLQPWAKIDKDSISRSDLREGEKI
ncbi:sialin-like [Brachionus plicatilis]|uniref:Sialin-like n=1 Tax=Brachionus plicatilis TaxID=10195 RepID=A0A3M7PZ61_BRAPC|nr:sialin-like [Brachionus plicatilis]